MAILLTGATGYLGSYVATGLLEDHDAELLVLVRARSEAEGRQRLWQAWQLHWPFDRFHELVQRRVHVVPGDLIAPALGLEPDRWRHVASRTDSVVHCAATLNRKSNKSCFNVNLRGTLQLIKLARAAHEAHGLRRFSHVSTMAVAGHRQGEVVHEDEAIEWTRSDYDPYARTKKFAEYLLEQLLGDVPITVFRPTTVLGDSRFPDTTQFDMLRAFVWLAHLPVLPLPSTARIDIVPADYVGRAIVHLHQSEQPRHRIYHLGAGCASPTYRAICDALVSRGHPVRPRFVPRLGRAFETLVRVGAATPRSWRLAPAMSLLQVFWPYIAFDTVFDNQRIVTELGQEPAPFCDYAYDLLRYAMRTKFRYPYRPWPEHAPA